MLVVNGISTLCRHKRKTRVLYILRETRLRNTARLTTIIAIRFWFEWCSQVIAISMPSYTRDIHRAYRAILLTQPALLIKGSIQCTMCNPYVKLELPSFAQLLIIYGRESAWHVTLYINILMSYIIRVNTCNTNQSYQFLFILCYVFLVKAEPLIFDEVVAELTCVANCVLC